MSENIIKCVAVGDGFVGKTTLLARLCKKECDKEYNPTIFDNHSISSVYNGQTYDIILIDTAGQEGYSMLRKQMQESADIFLLCFSVSSTDSFSNVKEVWLPEVEAYPSASKILIGTKSDLRNDPETVDKLNASGAIFVSNSQAMNFAQSHNMKYVECSSAAQEKIEDVLRTILEVNQMRMQEKKVPTRPCCINPILRILKRALCCKNNY